MTLTMELDDQTPLDATDVRAALTSQMSNDHVIVYLAHDNGAELAVGFRAGRGVCLWDLCSDDAAVTTGGTNGEVIVYGASEIPVPAGAEIDATTVIDAAEEFAMTGTRPTGVQWQPYGAEAFPVEDSPITPEALQALLGETDPGR
jgi:immunity protein Imm1 of predicted polymorphic toxin system